MSTGTWYFGTGTLLNPTSTKLRTLEVADSRPAELLDHEMVFFGPNGYIAPFPAEGATMEGVLHRMPDATLAKLDPLLSGSSDVRSVKAKAGGETIECVTHVLSREKIPADKDRAPLEAYIDILLEGAQHYGLSSDFVKLLKAKEARPRRSPADFTSFADMAPEEFASMPAEWTMESVVAKSAEGLAGETSDLSKDIYVAFNDKVCKYIGPRDGFHNWGLFKGSFLGRQAVFEFSKIQYDPKYGSTSDWESMTEEAKGYYEDWMFDAFGGTSNVPKMMKLVGKLAK